MTSVNCAALCVTALVSAVAVNGQTLSVSTHADPAPAELAAPVAAALTAGGPRVNLGAASVQFWWVTTIAQGDGHPAATGTWQQVPEGALIGAIRLDAPWRDIRGRSIKAGVYTLRYGVQPANGDHMGVSPFRDFLLVSPAAADQDPAPKGHNDAVLLSRQTLGTAHPAVLSLDPPETSAAVGSVQSNAAGHQAVVMEVPLGGSSRLRFGVILVGKIEA